MSIKDPCRQPERPALAAPYFPCRRLGREGDRRAASRFDTNCGGLSSVRFTGRLTHRQRHGLGKDAPGSPITDSALFPHKGFVWEFNYRGELTFMRQAEAQQEARGLTIEDGWRYFVLGWSLVTGDIFGIDVPVEGKGFEELSRIAAEVR